MSQLHVRVLEDGALHPQEKLSSPCVVDIYYNELLQPHLKREDEVFACIHWDDPTGSSRTTFTITEPDWRTDQSIDGDFCQTLNQDRTLLRTFLREMYYQVGIKLVRLSLHPLVFCFSHEVGNHFLRDINFQKLLKTFITNCCPRKTNIECKTQRMRGKSTCSVFNHGFSAAPRNCTDEEHEEDGQCDKRFTKIKKEMISHSKFISEQFASQQDDMNELMTSVKTLLNSMSSETLSETNVDPLRFFTKFAEDQQAAASIKVSLNEELVSPRESDEYCKDLALDEMDISRRTREEPETTESGRMTKDGTIAAKSPEEHRLAEGSGKGLITRNGHAPVNEEFDDTVTLHDQDQVSDDTPRRYDNSQGDVIASSNTSVTQGSQQNANDTEMTERKERRRDHEMSSSLPPSNDDAVDKTFTLTAEDESADETVTLDAEDESADETVTLDAEDDHKSADEEESIQDASRDFVQTARDGSKSFSRRSVEEKQSSYQSPRATADLITQQLTGGVLDEDTLNSFVGGIFTEENADSRFYRGLNKVLLTDKHSVLKADNCTDTMLCLDTSLDVTQKGLDDMKTAVHKFISGIEEVAADSGIEENIGIVTFGGQAELRQLPTNDYGVLREVVDSLSCQGSAPLHQAAMLTLACLSDNKREVAYGPFVAMKMVVMTAGRPSAPVDKTTKQVLYPNDQERMRVMVTIKEYGQTLGESGALKYIWIPVGNADRRFVESMVKLSKGKLVEADDIHQLSHFQRNRIIANNVLKAIEGSETNIDGTELDSFVDIFGNDMTPMDREEVKELVVEFMQTRESGEVLATDDFDNICNREERLIPLGSRVVRGPDWMWGDQDAEGPGTVINHVKGRDCVRVLWDSGHNNEYRCGCAMQFDLVIDEVCPRQFRDAQRAEIGVQVERGPDWSDEHDDEDGGPGNYGVIIRIKQKKVKVIWRNRNIKEYKFGENDLYEVQMRDATDYLLEMTSTFPDFPPAETTSSTNIETQPRSKTIVWQRQGDKGWENYPPEEQKKLMTDFNNGRPSSLLTRGKVRVSFAKKTETCLSGNKTTRDIRKVEV